MKRTLFFVLAFLYASLTIFGKQPDYTKDRKKQSELVQVIPSERTLTERMLTERAEPIKLIDEVIVNKNRIDVRINSAFKKAYLKEDFFVEYDEDINCEKLDYSIITLPFIMNVMSLIWVSGKEYTIPTMDKEIYASLEKIKQLFEIFYPKTPWKGKLIPEKLVSNSLNRSQQPMIALLFSGGVDSTAASLIHRDKKQLLITAWGQSCLPLQDRKMWETIKKQVISFAHEYGHENAFIKSNYYSFLNLKTLTNLSPEIVTWRIDTIEDIGWIGLTAPILFAKGISTLHIASTENWNSKYANAANPYIDGLITYASIHTKHNQFDVTRFDKIALINDLANRHLVKRPILPVCQKPGGIVNCGSCEKCCITLLCLYTLAANPREYGFKTTYAEVKKNTLYLCDNNTLSITTIEQLKDLQKHIALAKHPTHDFSWLMSIDFSTKKTYDVKKQQPVDWKIVAGKFPEIKSPYSGS